MARPPARSLHVFVVGAGLSASLNLPNTRELLQRVHDLAGRRRYWGLTRNLVPRLQNSYEFFYPEKSGTGFRPDVVDFFSLLKAYTEIGSGMSGGLRDSRALLGDLRFAIANALVFDLREIDNVLRSQHVELNQILEPGNVVITLNWDLVLERYCYLHGIPVRFDGWVDGSEVVLLKLHGSIDWTLRSQAARPVTQKNYAVLRERLTTGRQYTIPIRSGDKILRTRAMESWNDSWRKIKSRTNAPFIVTMSQGKSDDLSKIDFIWRTAYDALSAASEIEIVGYSMPHDDVEVRALLRAGIRRGSSAPRVTVRNPAPDVHDRVRNYLVRSLRSNYVPFPGFR